MKTLKNYAPLALMLLCAAVIGTLLGTGVIDLKTIPALVHRNPALAAAVVLLLYIAKGFCGVILHNALILAISMTFDLPAALLLNGLGTALCLSISYGIGHYTNPASLQRRLESHPKIKRYFTSGRQYGFLSCFCLHLLGLNMEVLGVLFGIMRLPFLTYLASSWLAIAPGMVCLCILGEDWNLSSPVLWVVAALELILIAFGFLYTKKKILNAPGEDAKPTVQTQEKKAEG